MISTSLNICLLLYFIKSRNWENVTTSQPPCWALEHWYVTFWGINSPKSFALMLNTHTLVKPFENAWSKFLSKRNIPFLTSHNFAKQYPSLPKCHIRAQYAPIIKHLYKSSTSFYLISLLWLIKVVPHNAIQILSLSLKGNY